MGEEEGGHELYDSFIYAYAIEVHQKWLIPKSMNDLCCVDFLIHTWSLQKFFT